jgi:hypothetical protein
MSTKSRLAMEVSFCPNHRVINQKRFDRRILNESMETNHIYGCSIHCSRISACRSGILPGRGKPMNIKYRHVLVLLLLGALMCIQAPAETIISVASINLFGGFQMDSGEGYRVGWTQNYTYAGVTVAAQLSGEFGLTGQAYLTTQIGPGTSTANQIASTTFSIPGGQL